MQDILENVKRRALTAKGAKIIGGVLLAVLAVFLVGKLVGWAEQARENRQWINVNKLTPDRLVARCGQPLEDKSEDVFPIVRREMSYKAWGKKAVVLTFSRTADEPNNWVLLSMTDSEAGPEYDTPSSKIEALPCLDARE